jgi:hypothetical protein
VARAPSDPQAYEQLKQLIEARKTNSRA